MVLSVRAFSLGTLLPACAGPAPQPPAPGADLLPAIEGPAAPAAPDLALGSYFSCALSPAGEVRCWGMNVGEVSLSGGGWSRIGAMHATVCGIRDGGSTLECAGSVPLYEPLAAPLRWTALGLGTAHGCALRSDGSALCWGYLGRDYYGETMPPDERFADIDSGGYFSCGIAEDGEIACWGGSEGRPATSPPPGEFVDLDCGGAHACAIDAGGALVCWGGSRGGGWDEQLGAPPGTFSSVSCGGGLCCAIRTGGELACWGASAQGQSSPPGGRFSRVEVSVSGFFACAVAQGQGQVLCWGQGAGGQTAAPSDALL